VFAIALIDSLCLVSDLKYGFNKPKRVVRYYVSIKSSGRKCVNERDVASYLLFDCGV